MKIMNARKTMGKDVFRKVWCIFLFLSLLLSIAVSGASQEKIGIEFVKKLARDIIVENYRNALIITVRGTLEEEAILELEKELNYADIRYTLQEIEPGTGAEFRSVISGILKTGIETIIPLGDAGALGFIIQEIRNLGVEQPVYLYITTEEGETVLKEQDIMPVYTMVLSLERPAEEDVIFMKNGDKLNGKMTSSSIGIQTPYGQIFFDSRLIAGIIFGAGAYMERIYTVNQSYFSGFINNPTIDFRLSSGAEIVVRKEKIARILFCVREKELLGIPGSDIFYMVNGDVFAGRLTDEVLQVKTAYADVTVGVNTIRDISFIAEEQVFIKITLYNGDEINGVLRDEDIHINLDAGPPITIYQDKIKEIRMRIGYEPVVIVPVTTPTPLSPTNDMVLIPDGEFLMGSNYGDPDETPIHKVYLDAFYIDKYEVTNLQFSEFLNQKGNQEEGGVAWLNTSDEDCVIEYRNGKYQPKSGYENHPVIEVSWFGAMAYAEWAGKRLPTEAEWEKVAIGGLAGKKYPWGDSIDSSRANYGENVGQTTPVGRYPPNNYGLYNMGGNVCEWVSDWYGEDYYSSSDSYRNPQGPNYGSERVIRGAGWSHDARYLRCASRNYVNPDSTSNHLGFRCAKSP